MSQATRYRVRVKRIALAGGIGAGKSTVLEYLGALGFVTVDADLVYHDLVYAGSPLLHTLVDAFGSAILGPDGGLDRGFLAAVVFHDDTALARLNAITHPAVGRALRAALEDATGLAAFVAIPLLRAEHRHELALDEVWSVLVSPEVAAHRLVNQRAMSDDDARARIAHQMSNEERAAISDEVIWNDADRPALEQRIDELLRERGLRGH